MHLAIVGNSAAALSALEAFRKRDRTSTVTVLSDEPAAAYSRVLLPYFLRGKLPYDGLFIRRPDYYSGHGAELLLGTRVGGVDAAGRRLELSGGRSLAFDQLLLATGSTPSKPPIPGLEGPHVQHLWTLADALGLDARFREGGRALVLGAGFVALQAAWAAHRRGLDVAVVEIVDQVLPRVLDAPAAGVLREQIEACGVAVHTGTRTEGLEHDRNGGLRVVAAGLDPFAVDLVIVGTGVRPNTHLLPEAVEPGRPGFAVDAGMATGVEGIYAAGDVARGPVSGGGAPEIHALWPTAVEQGAVAGANLAGAELVYSGSLSMNVTEMFGLTVASLGRVTEVPGDRVEVRLDLPGIRYFKLVSRGEAPVGALALGGSAGASLLGRLRPAVRHGKPLGDVEAFLDGSALPRRLAPGAVALPRDWPGHVSSREEVACASSS